MSTPLRPEPSARGIARGRPSLEEPAEHRQTGYVPSPTIDPPDALGLPPLTRDLDAARRHLSEYGLCFVPDVLSHSDMDRLRDALDTQAAAERALGDLAPPAALGNRQSVSNMVNKGKVFLDLVERTETDELAGFMLGRTFLVSSITGGMFHAPTTEPQPLHRDQGYVPATVNFPAACNLFWLLDDFTPDNGSTHVVPGSHRWRPEYQIKPPPREMSVQVEVPAGSVFAWEGRIWHGLGVNTDGAPRRSITTFFCLPWMRQQENWGVSCLQEVLDEASPKLRARLGLRTYGTLGGVNGTRTSAAPAGLGNADVEFPDYIIGEGATLHPLRRVARRGRADASPSRPTPPAT